MKYQSFSSPAKINLFFRVLKKNSDSYHEIASLYSAIDLVDIVQMKLAKEDSLTSTDASLVSPSNLILKAISLFRRETKLTFGVDVHLVKNIPLCSGMGGGSSNGATALWAINELLRFPLSTKRLAQIGSMLGSDVPFFFSSGMAYCEGRGDRVSDMPPCSFSGWVAKPHFGMHTEKVYRKVEVDLLKKRDPRSAVKVIYSGAYEGYNDLEEAAFKVEPRLMVLKRKLLDMGLSATMTGSGSAFFCIGDIQPKPLEGVSFYFVNNIHRKKDRWYNFQEKKF